MASTPAGTPSGSSSAPGSSSIAQTAAVGVLSFTQPAQTAADVSYYKIAEGQSVTFGWTFTQLLVTPTHLTLSAFCADNGNTYPVGPTDGVIPGNALSVIWDPWAYQQKNPAVPLIQGSYTLSIWGDQPPTALAAPGLLKPNSDLHFALYLPQAYTPLANWSCPGCSPAGRNAVAKDVPIALVATCFVILLSTLGVLRRAFGLGGRDHDT